MFYASRRTVYEKAYESTMFVRVQSDILLNIIAYVIGIINF